MHVKIPNINNLPLCCDTTRPLVYYGNVLFNDALNTFYLRLYGRKKEGIVLFNDALNTFYLRLYGRKKEGIVLFNDTLKHILFTVIWKEEGRKCFI